MIRLIDNIDSPEDLKKVPLEDLPKVAQEIRDFILDAVSETGGHLASNLGVVDLTVALHYLYDSPRDKIVWDVGHQSYPHKILTGRKSLMLTLRKRGGISGFTSASESPHDPFGAGHASTSISAALGLARARDHLGGDNHVIAVIGDGAMTGGLAYEALNNAGTMRTDLLVIVNDNEMSISGNVGAILHHFNRLITSRFYNRAKQNIEGLVAKIPHVGRRLRRTMNKLQEGVKGILTPALLFEELGFRYFGPIDGHNLGEMIETLKGIKNLQEPRVLHIITQKGKGYPPAERNPSWWHGVKPFNQKTGTPIETHESEPMTYSEAFGRTALRLAETDKRVVGITAAMPTGTRLDILQKTFPDRFYDVGIAEEHAVTFAAGMAQAGIRPIVAIYSTFLQRSVDQIIHDVCLQDLPVMFCIDRAGIVSADGGTHQGVFDISYLREVPNLVLLAPSDERELARMMVTAFQMNCPVAIRYPNARGTGVGLEAELPEPLPIGKAKVLREGTDAAILAIGSIVCPSLKAAEILATGGLECRVIDARFIKPIDTELIGDLVRENMPIVTVEEHALAGGFGSAVIEAASAHADHIPPILRLGVPDRFIEHGSRAELLAELGLDAEGIAHRIRAFIHEHVEHAAK